MEKVLAQSEEHLRLPSYGGQALIEGVLMKNQRYLAAAMRTPEGEIVTRLETINTQPSVQWRKIPFIRGPFILWDALTLGLRYLTLSANIQAEKPDEKIEGLPLYLSLFLSFGLAIGLFFIVPALIGHGAMSLLKTSTWIGNVMEGVVRLAILVGYIWSVGKLSDIQRVFAYHGAEHKTINAFEAGIELSVNNVKKCSLIHPRCGTSFTLTVVVISIIFFSLLGPLPLGIKIISRILAIPLISSLAYEYIRLAAKHMSKPFFKLIYSPNLALQKLTTREPDDGMIETAIKAFDLILQKESVESQISPPG